MSLSETEGEPAASNQPPAQPAARPSTDSIADGVGVRGSYAVALDVFEGPLDLLLHLVRRHELDILDIPISFITEKYIEYISLARSLDIEVAGEYLLMAATLAYLKSRELLPAAPAEEEAAQDEDEGVDPREELIRRLIEYERFRDAGLDLGNRPLTGRDVFPRGGDLSVLPPEPGLAPVTLFRLAEAYNRVLDRAKIREDHEVVLEPITVRTRMHQLSLMLEEQPRIVFEDLFLRREWSSERELRQMLVVTLMSVLEMVKLGILGVHQAQGSESISLERAVEVERMRTVIVDFRGDDEEPALPGAEATPVGAEATTPEVTPVAVEVMPVAVGAPTPEVPLEAAAALDAEAPPEADAPPRAEAPEPATPDLPEPGDND